MVGAFLGKEGGPLGALPTPRCRLEERTRRGRGRLSGRPQTGVRETGVRAPSEQPPQDWPGDPTPAPQRAALSATERSSHFSRDKADYCPLPLVTFFQGPFCVGLLISKQ